MVNLSSNGLFANFQPGDQIKFTTVLNGGNPSSIYFNHNLSNSLGWTVFSQPVSSSVGFTLVRNGVGIAGHQYRWSGYVSVIDIPNLSSNYGYWELNVYPVGN